MLLKVHKNINGSFGIPLDNNHTLTHKHAEEVSHHIDYQQTRRPGMAKGTNRTKEQQPKKMKVSPRYVYHQPHSRYIYRVEVEACLARDLRVGALHLRALRVLLWVLSPAKLMQFFEHLPRRFLL